MTKYKSYNPFKMWGSYVGLTLGIIFVLFFGAFNYITAAFLNNILKISPNFILIIYPVFGFLIGWGIHSLIRKLTRGKI